MYILFDIGGTTIRIGAVARIGDAPVVHTYPNTESYKEGIELIIKTAKNLARDTQIVALAGGIAGPLNKYRTGVVGGINIPTWWHKPIVDDLSTRMNGVPVLLENDAALGALGEAHFGAGIGRKIVAFITVSTGVGGARVVDGELDENSRGFEPGWQIVDASNALCRKNSDHGFLIDIISGAGVKKHYGRSPQEITDVDFWNEQARYLAYGLNNVVVFWSPDIIILGGSIALKSRLDCDKVRAYLRNTLSVHAEMPEIALSRLGDNSVMYGAMALLG